MGYILYYSLYPGCEACSIAAAARCARPPSHIPYASLSHPSSDKSPSCCLLQPRNILHHYFHPLELQRGRRCHFSTSFSKTYHFVSPTMTANTKPTAQVVSLAASFIVACIFAVGLRFLAMQRIRRSMKMHDWFCIASLVCTLRRNRLPWSSLIDYTRFSALRTQ
jgi:hypothetical protein